MSRQVTPAETGAARYASGQGGTAGCEGGESAPGLAAVAYVEALDGSERTVLLRMIAAAYPGVVEAGAELVAQWRAECAERRRKDRTRKAHDRRRRRRAEAGGGG